MDMSLIYAILIALVPVVLAIIFTKVYNVIHGIVSFLFFGAILMLCLKIFGEQMPETMVYFEQFGGFYNGVTNLCCNPENGLVTFVAYTVLNALGLGDIVLNNPDFVFYFYLVLVAIVFLVSQIIASCIFRKRARRRKNLQRQAKRY